MRFLFGALHIISIITVSMRKPINHTTTYDIINDTTTTRRQQGPGPDQYLAHTSITQHMHHTSVPHHTRAQQHKHTSHTTSPPATTSATTATRLFCLHYIHQHNDYDPWNRPVSLQPLNNHQRHANLRRLRKRSPTPRTQSPTNYNERGEQQIERGERRIERRGATRTVGAYT